MLIDIGLCPFAGDDMGNIHQNDWFEEIGSRAVSDWIFATPTRDRKMLIYVEETSCGSNWAVGYDRPAWIIRLDVSASQSPIDRHPRD